MRATAEDGAMSGSALEQQLGALTPERRALYERLMAQRGAPSEYALSEAQRGLWFLDRLAPQSPLYAVTWRFDLEGKLDIAAFHDSLGDVIARHEALRTRFGFRDQWPMQFVEARVALDVPLDDVSSLPVGERAAAIDEVIRAEARLGFDLSVAPLFRMRLVRMADDHHVAIASTALIVVDEASFNVFLADLRTAYERRASGSDVPWAPAPQFSQFAAWQQERLAGPAGERLTAFWRHQLDGMPGHCELPTGRVRPSAQTFAGNVRLMTLPPDTVRTMRAVASQQGASLLMSYLAVVAMLLGRYTGRCDICIGTPMASRLRPEHTSLIGPCANMVVIRVNLSGDPSFRQILDRVRDVCLEAFSHQEMPFERLVDSVPVYRSLAYNPLFQVACALTEAEAVTAPAGGVIFSAARAVPSGFAKFDLSLHSVLSDDEITVTVDYSASVIDDSAAQYLCGHLGMLWRDAAARPDVPSSRLTMLTAGELALAQAPPAMSAAPPLADVIAGHARLRPDAHAVSYQRTGIDYGQLDVSAQLLAERFTAAGVGSQTIVTVRIARSVELVVALLALVRVGARAAVVPPGRPDASGSWQAEVTVAADEGTRALGPGDQERYVISTTGHVPAGAGAPASLARMADSFAAVAGALGLHADDRLAITAREESAAFLAEIVAGLTAGAHCELIDAGLAGNPAALGQVIDAHQVTAVWLPRRPAAALGAIGFGRLRLLVTEPGATGIDHVRTVMVHTVPGAGPWAVSPGAARDARSAPLVSPAPGIGVHVLDSVGQPMPCGLIGDLYLAAYGGQAEPTGLRVLRRADGLIELHGTAAETLHVDGVTVQPAAIERCLVSHPGVREACVAANPAMPAGEATLTAFGVRASGAGPDERELAGFLAGELPQHMLPASLVLVDALPLTADGHVHLPAFPWPATPGLGATAAYVAPRDALERLVVSAWCELFERERIGIEDNFFELGGHSLLAVRLLSQIGELFGTQLPVSVLFGAATPEGLAGKLTELLGGPAAARDLAEAIEQILLLPDDDARGESWT